MPSETPAPHTRTWIVEDHCTVRELVVDFIRRTPGFEVVGSSGNAAPLLETKPDIDLVVLDLMLSLRSGTDVIAQVSKWPRPPKVLVFSGVTSPHTFAVCLRYGIAGFVEKSASLDEISKALHAIRAGGTYFSSGASSLLGAMASRNLAVTSDAQQDRENDFILRIGRGLTMKSIAAELQISEQYAYRLRQSLYQKWQVSSDQELLIRVIQAGLISVDAFTEEARPSA